MVPRFEGGGTGARNSLVEGDDSIPVDAAVEKVLISLCVCVFVWYEVRREAEDVSQKNTGEREQRLATACQLTSSGFTCESSS